MTAMTQLTETQTAIIVAAAARPDLVAIPLPDRLKGGAAAKVVASMLAKGLLDEVEANVRAGEAVWRGTGDGHGVTLVATEAALTAAGIAAVVAKPVKTRSGTKQSLLIEMLRRPDGASLDEIVKATDWQKHTVRGALAGALKKRLGLVVESEAVEDRGRVYKIVDPA